MGENCDIFSGFWFYWGRGLAISRRRAAIPVGRTLFFPWPRPTGCRLVFSEPFSLCLNFKPNRGIGWRFALCGGLLLLGALGDMLSSRKITG